MSDGGQKPLLAVEDLTVSFHTADGVVPAVRGVSFVIGRGRTLALVGESGSGKSVTAGAILRLIQPPGRITGGRMWLHSARAGTVDLAGLGEEDEVLYQVRGGLVSMIFQEPMTALSPVHTVGSQIAEAILLHQKLGVKQARTVTVEMLGKVGISNPDQCYDRYPHELSGGMRQRVVIAMALVCKPGDEDGEPDKIGATLAVQRKAVSLRVVIEPHTVADPKPAAALMAEAAKFAHGIRAQMEML
jgi:ABC-type dipeptide/oligopeptide/nickel transport system ATPase component